jgi:hypothetical protein
MSNGQLYSAARMLTGQRDECYSDFTVGIVKVLFSTTNGFINSLTYIIQPYMIHFNPYPTELNTICN